MIAVSEKQIILNPRELKARLQGTLSAEIGEQLAECEQAMRKALDCKYFFRETPVKIADDGVDFGFVKVQSQNLRKNLQNCTKAYIFAGTLGHDVDRLLRTSGLLSPLRQFLIDALASTAIEALCDYAQAKLPQPTFPRFSAGYGDFSLEHQQELLDFLKADQRLGITLRHSGLMNPTKSVTAVIGIRNQQNT